MDATPFDFRKPTPLSVEWRRRLGAWWGTAFGLMNKAWSKELPAALEANVGALDVSYARPVLAAVTDETLLYKIKLGDSLVSALILPRTLMLNVVGLMLGDSTPATDRELTAIEERLGEYFLVNHWLKYFRESWPGAGKIAWMLDGRETNLACSRLFATGDALVSLGWRLKGGWGETAGTWYLPKKPLLELLANAPAPADKAVEAQTTIRREAIVQTLALNIQVVLGSAELRLSELSSLQIGDVVLLNQRAGDGVTARVGGQSLFRGHLGKVGAWKALRVETNLKK